MQSDAAPDDGEAPDADGGLPHGTGFVMLTNVGITNNDGPREQVYAVFTREDPDGCMLPLSPGCTIKNCRDSSSYFGKNAGFLGVGGGGSPFSTEPDSVSNAHYYHVSTTDALIGAQKLTVSVTGDVVPTFTGNIEFPFPATFLGDAGAPWWVIDPKSDFTVSWTIADDAPVLVRLRGQGPPPGYYYVDCLFDGAAGTGTVPSKLLQRLKQEGDAVHASLAPHIQFGAYRTVQIGVADWTMTLHAFNPVLDRDFAWPIQ